ncbi:MAG: MBL fold metallo-hydrolase [Pseudobdellovibrionaceae bacterium]
MNGQYPKSDHFDGYQFFNPGVDLDKPLSALLKWQLTSNKKTWPDSVSNIAKPQVATEVKDGEAFLTFINHATFLIQMSTVNILTDPVFSQRASPVQWAGPKRVRPPGLAIEQLPKIDLVVVSHNHYDHMDLVSLKDLKHRFDPVFIVPLGNKRYFEKFGDEKVIELDWWQTHQILGVDVTLTPAQHWSARGMFDRREALWGGFYFQGLGKKIYFAGDSGYCQCFTEVQRRLTAPEIALIPIGAYEPRWFMKESHLNPEESVQSHLDIGAKTSIAMHFGTFPLTDESIDDPIVDLQKAKDKKQLSPEAFLVMEVGETRKF